MANLKNLAFNGLNNDELFDILRQSPENQSKPSRESSNSYETLVTQNINSLSVDLNSDFNSDHDLAQIPSSKYITENQAKDIIESFSKDTFSLLHLNIRSINKHFDELQTLLQNSKNKSFSVIGLTETWLSSNTNLPYAINGYDLLVNNRSNRTGGGVALYISHSFDFIVREDLNTMNDTIESLFVEISIPYFKNIIVGVIYRPPNTNSIDFLTQLEDLLRDPIFLNKDSFIMGDFNIDLLKHINSSSEDFLDTFLSASFLPLISKPTRVATHSATLLDNIFCNILPTPNSSIIISDITDHYPIMAHFELKQTNTRSFSLPERRRASHENIASLGTSLDRADWSSVLNTSDVNTALENFLEIFNEHLNRHVPKKEDNHVSYKTAPRLPWVSKSLLRSINRKNRLFYKFKMKKTQQSKNRYISYKNTLTKLLRSEKRKYYAIQLEQYKHDIKNTWKILKQAMNISKMKSKITKLKFKDKIIEDPDAIANTFNSYFSTIGENLSQNIPLASKHFSTFLSQPIPNSIFFVPTTKYEITDIVTAFNNKHSAGPDGISNFILKGVISSVADPLEHIFNLSITSGVFPEQMKIAKVIPLFKKGDILDASNYRPISLLSSLSKILEKLIFMRTVKFLKDNNTFTNSQFGFRQKHSTIHALLNFVDKVAHNIDDHSHLIGIFLDFSKAFDTINHDILLYKLSHYGIRGKALEWFRNYLNNRKQYVYLNGFNSSYKDINCGVPQGSILGPLLFIIYINDFCNSSDILSFILFADDSNVFFSHKNPHILARTVNCELKNVTQWIRANKLSLNLQKTKYMIFSNTIETLPTDIVLDEIPLENVSHIKFLGITVDNKLSWKTHIENTVRTISRNIGVINRLKSHIPSSSLLTLYSSLILPYLNYGILAWGNTHQILLEKLLIQQKKVLRIICNVPPRSHTDSLFSKHKILRIHDLYRFQLGQFMYKFKNNSLPQVFDSLFLQNQSLHDYPTRQSDEFHLPLLRTLLAQKSFIFTGPKFWNSLENDIKNAPSLYTFKNKLKKKLLKAYNCNS